MNERSFIVNPCSQASFSLNLFQRRRDEPVRPPLSRIAPAVATPLGDRPVGLPSDRPQTGGYGSC